MIFYHSSVELSNLIGQVLKLSIHHYNTANQTGLNVHGVLEVKCANFYRCSVTLAPSGSAVSLFFSILLRKLQTKLPIIFHQAQSSPDHFSHLTLATATGNIQSPSLCISDPPPDFKPFLRQEIKNECLSCNFVYTSISSLIQCLFDHSDSML